MTDIVRIDSRVVGFADEPVRILAVCFQQTGELLVQKVEKFSTLAVPEALRAETVVITDAPELIQDWQIGFDAREHLDSAITVYQMRRRSMLVELDKSLNRYNPSNILQVRKVDEHGLKQEFDSNSLDNGHVAVLLCVWASSQIALNHSRLTPPANPEADDTLLPFSVSGRV